MGSEDGVSPDFLFFSTNNTEFAEKREGYEGVGTSHCQVASDLLQLAQAGLQFSCYVVYRKPKDTSREVTDSTACLVQKFPGSCLAINSSLLSVFSILVSSFFF